MKGKVKFHVTASAVTLICVVSWFFVQYLYIAPSGLPEFVTILNIALFCLALFAVLLIFAGKYRGE